ncbi:hypothetical protein J2S19_004447 [Metabacillus malikii]|uniref:Uncharacterized protein n=1 Tax=Metabacillus malikii TaxID=1504265 RepID=A0ABT9ZMT9_9BACI|nr:hypothetical protein [Metabacillus malikii]
MDLRGMQEVIDRAIKEVWVSNIPNIPNGCLLLFY